MKKLIDDNELTLKAADLLSQIEHRLEEREHWKFLRYTGVFSVLLTAIILWVKL